jgi:hypothetical protein
MNYSQRVLGMTTMTDANFSHRKDLPSFVKDLVYSGVPLISSLISILFQVSSPSVIRSLVLILITCSVLLVIRRIRMDWKDGRLAGVAVVTGFFGWYAFPAFINFYSEQNSYINDLSIFLDQGNATRAVAYLSLFLFIWVLTDHYFDKIRLFRSEFPTVFYKTNPVRLTMLGIACCTVGFIPYVVSGMGISEIISLIFQSRLAEKPWIHTENLGNFRSPFLFIAQSAMTAGACILWLVTQEKSFPVYQKIVIGVCALIVSLLIFFDQGTRSVVALIILPVLLIKIFEVWKRSKLRFMISVFVFGVVFVALLQFLLFFRISGIPTGLPYPQILKWATLDDTTDMFSETVYALHLIPASHDFFRESVLVQFLVSPIPRFVWPSKPANQVVWYYTLHRWGIDIYEGGGNVFPGIVGQSYMSWGVWGPIFLGMFMGCLSSMADDFLARTNNFPNLYYRAIGVIISVWILLSYRVISPGLLYPVMIVFFIIRISSMRRVTVFV